MVASANRLKIQIPKSWAAQDRTDRGAVFRRYLSRFPGSLQVSWAIYTRGPNPNADAQKLMRMAIGWGDRINAGDLSEAASNSCVFGSMGTAVFTSPRTPRIQLWLLSNGKDFINISHICPLEPDPVEISEAQEIARTVTLDLVP
jgi:hypothetical protein